MHAYGDTASTNPVRPDELGTEDATQGFIADLPSLGHGGAITPSVVSDNGTLSDESPSDTQARITEESAADTGICSLPDEPSDEQKEQWFKAAQSEAARSRDGAVTAVSMMVLAWLMNGREKSQTFFEGILATNSLSAPKSRWKLATAAAALSLADSKHKDRKKAKAARQLVDRDAAAGEALLELAEKKLPGALTEYKASTVSQLNAVVRGAGGLTELAASKRVPKANKKRDRLIKLDPTRQRNVAAARALARFQGPTTGGTPALKISGTEASGSTAEPLEIVGDKALNVFATLNLLDPTIEFLGEMVLIGSSIAEEDTDIAVDRDDDPEDPDTKTRLTRRQYTMRKSGDWLVSTILQSSCVVVHVRPHLPLLDRSLPGDVKAETKRRILVEENLLDPLRWSAFDAEVPNASETASPFRLGISTEAAQDEKDRGRDIGFAFQRHSGQTQLDIAEAHFSPSASGSITFRMWSRRDRTNVSKLSDLKKLDKVILSHEFSPGTWTIHVPKRDKYEEDVQGSGPVTAIKTLASDFMRVSAAISALPVLGSIEYSIDKQGLMLLSFSTGCADYRVLIPMATDKGLRSDRFMRSFEPQPWPDDVENWGLGGESSEPGTDSCERDEDPEV